MFCCCCSSGWVLLERISSISRIPYLYLFNLSPSWLEVLLAIAASVVIQFKYFIPTYIFSYNHLVTTFGQWQSDRTKSFLNNSKRNLKCVFSLWKKVQLQPWHGQTIFCLHICLLTSIWVLLEKVTELTHDEFHHEFIITNFRDLPCHPFILLYISHTLANDNCRNSHSI